MAIEITFNTEELDERHAKALVAMLAVLQPSALDDWRSGEPDLFAGRTFGSAQTDEIMSPQPYPLDRPEPYVSAAATVNDPNTVFGDPVALYGALGGKMPDAPTTPEEAFGEPPLADGAASVAPPAPVASPATPTVDVDRQGLPYDKRIHSNPPSKIGAGNWRRKKGVSNDLVATVEAELRQVMAANPQTVTPGPAPVSPPAPSPTVPSPPPASPDTAPSGPPTVTPQVAPPPPAPPAGPGPSATPPAPTASPSNAQLFAALMKRVNISQTRADDKLTPEEVTEALQACELTKLPDFLKRPDLIEAFEAVLGDRLASAPTA